MVEHLAFAWHLRSVTTCYQLAPSDKILQFASPNVDASLEQIFSTWCSGAQLILLSTNRLTAQNFLAWLEIEQLTVADLPPAYWESLGHEANLQSLASLNLLILGGETWPTSLAHQTRFRFPHLRLLNAYGPTETTITTTVFEVTDSFPDHYRGPNTPLGRPLANTQIYLLDATQNLTPLGIPGELRIAGAGLARGYLNRPDLTAAKFVELELFGQCQRVYKTGDLARWLPDGKLEYLGRLDHQIKLRGFRIELGEIEAVLTQQEAVKECAVVIFLRQSPATVICILSRACC
jgi:amino acid adenylation domain-containing protein